MLRKNTERVSYADLEEYKIMDAREIREIANNSSKEYWSKVVAPKILEASINGNKHIVLYPSIDFQSIIDLGESLGYDVKRKSDYSPWHGGYNFRLIIKW